MNFTLSPPREDGTRINGELHLQWAGTHIQPMQRPPQAVVTVPNAQPQQEEEENAEHRLGELLAQMTPQERESFLAKLPKKAISYDEIVLPQSEAQVAPHLPGVLHVQPPQALPMPAVDAVGKVERDRRVLNAWCTAFGGNVPGFPNACSRGLPMTRGCLEILFSCLWCPVGHESSVENFQRGAMIHTDQVSRWRRKYNGSVSFHSAS